MRRLLVMVLATTLPACSDAGPPARVPTEPLPVPVVIAEPPVVSAPAPKHYLPVITAPPDAVLQMIAVAEDGGAAVTIDVTNHVRLWPTLDGSREPIVVLGMAAAAIAIGREADGFVIAELDVIGTLEIYRYSQAGVQLARVQVAGEQPFDQIEVTPRGVLALRSDDIVEIYSSWGTRDAQLVPEPGSRVARLVTRNGGALALTTMQNGEIRGRWIELAGTPRWGATTPAFAHPSATTVATGENAIDVAQAVLAPDHGSLAARRADHGGTTLVDLATGVSTPVGEPKSEPLGFTGPDELVLQGTSGIEWWTSGKLVQRTGPRSIVTPGSISDGRVVGLLGGQLVMIAPKQPLGYLGYDIVDIGTARATPSGLVVAQNEQSPELRFGADLRLQPVVAEAGSGISLPIRSSVRWLDHVQLDAGHVLAIGSSATDSRWLSVVDTKTLDDHPLPIDIYDEKVHYDPASHLVAATGIARIFFARFDPATTTFAEPAALDIEEPTALTTYFVDRTKSGGFDAIVVDQREGGAQVFAVTIPATPGATLKGKRQRVRGIVSTVDRAGRIYANERTGDLVVHEHEHELVRVKLSKATGIVIVPDPDSARFLVLANRNVTAYVDGKPVWTIASPFTTDAHWVGDAIILQGGGLARIDPADGHVIERRCGWGFGLHTKPVAAGPAVCELATN